VVRQINRLSARAVETLSKRGRHADGGGLYLSISDEGRRRWVFMYVLDGKQREAGLGSAGKGGVPLKAAREQAAEGRAMLKSGLDPLAEWNKPAAESGPTFGAAADEYLAAHDGIFRNEKHKAQWRMTLTRYCEPIRNMQVDAVDTEAVFSVLKPLWARAPETASRLRGRIEAVLDAARARGHIGRNEANPARWRGHLDKLLPKRPKLTRGRHAAMPYADVPAFVAALRERPAIAARSLEFCILTAARSGEALAARWAEINFEAKVWVVPPERTKGAVNTASRCPSAPSPYCGRCNARGRMTTSSPANGLAVRCPTWRSKCCSGGLALLTPRTAFEALFATGRATKRTSLAKLRNMRSRTSSATRPSKPTAEAMRSPGDAS
jgi:integrase